MSLPLIYTLALLATAGAALWRGGWTTKRVSLAYLAAQLAALVAPHHRYHHFEVAYFLIDAALLGGLLWITLRSRLRWPVLSTALQTITVMGELAHLTTPSMTRMTYYVLVQWTAWPALLMMLFGVSMDWRAGSISSAY